MEKQIYKTIEESRTAYTDYVNAHINAIKDAFEIFANQLLMDILSSQNASDTEILLGVYMARLEQSIEKHDESKFSEEEFEAYRARFYPCKQDKELPKQEIEEKFEKAWEHHYSENSHHPEYYYTMFNKPIKMRVSDLAEMVLDWIAVSMVHKSNVLDWWASGRKEKKKMLLNYQFEIVDSFLNQHKDQLDFSEK